MNEFLNEKKAQKDQELLFPTGKNTVQKSVPSLVCTSLLDKARKGCDIFI